MGIPPLKKAGSGPRNAQIMFKAPMWEYYIKYSKYFKVIISSNVRITWRGFY